jgi:hypothetical protein
VGQSKGRHLRTSTVVVEIKPRLGVDKLKSLGGWEKVVEKGNEKTEKGSNH